METILHWLIGPQLIGFILLFSGYIQKTYPPTDIDGGYGFKTSTSRKNQQTFDEGNRYSAKLMTKVGAMLLLTGLILIPFVDAKHVYISMLLMVLSMIVSFPLIITSTNNHLKKLFDI
jgi:hypothetical protein